MTEPTRPRSLILLDLDGFKAYNDSFGHGAGDELLARLGRALQSVTAGRGKAYRLGGDEFCLLADAGLDREGDEGLLADARAALSQAGEGFRITASAGTVLLPVEAADVSAALKLADERMYDGKAHARASAERRECDVTVVPLVGRGPASEIASCAWTVALDLGLSAAEAEDVGLATERHDAGKATVGDEPAGEEIPLRARIVAVCDAFVAMTSEPAWRPPDGPEAALVELRRRAVAGHFDPRVVDAFCAAVERRPSVAA
jgi:diguanylate cyclase (GGDEF)-like protein